MVELKSIPSNKLSHSIAAVDDDDNVLLALSHAVLNLLNDFLLSLKSCLFFFLNSSAKCSTNRVSKSSPPKCVSPAVAFTSNTPSSIVNKDTSKVPPPQSNINTFFSPFLSSPYAIAAAVGSFIILNTFNPAITPASFVACL